MVAWLAAAAAVSSIGALGLGAALTRRLLHYRNANPAPDTATEVSMDRYRPMARLLDAEDLRFLTSRPGYRREMGARLRAARRRIFRMYLAELSADFRQLHAAARRMAAEAPEQHAGLVPVLMRQQFAFWRSLAGIELRLALSWTGLEPGDARSLTAIVEELQRALTAAAPAQSPASA